MHESPGQGSSAISLKPCLQKKLRDGLTAVEITLAVLFAWGVGGIAVRTKWQSGTMTRQHHGIAPKGKPPDRRREVCFGEIQPDLSRKINSRSCPVQLFFYQVRMSFLERQRKREKEEE